MTRDSLLRFAALSLALMLGACHTMRFDISHLPTAAVAPPIEEWNSYWLGGVTPLIDVDVSQKCPNGAVAIRESTTFLNGLVAFVTLGIYTPRTSWYYCRARPYAPPAPPGVTP